MTAINMKSDLLVESKLRPESRQPLQRRRISGKASCSGLIENGDCDPELNLAIQESLKLARQNELKAAAAAKSAALEDVENEPNRPNGPAGVNTGGDGKFDQKQPRSSSENKPVQSAQKLPARGKSSSKQLQGLLTLHLDLIQHQQEVITTKDREITNLRGDKEALKCRLERMERRMAILRHKEDVLEAAQQVRQVPNTDSPQPQHPTLEQRTANKRKSSLEPPTLNKRFSKESCQYNRSVPSSTYKPFRQPRSFKETYKRSSYRPRDRRHDADSDQEILERQRFLQKRSKIRDEHTVLRTEKLAYVTHYIPPFEDDYATIHKRIQADAAGKAQSDVEIPTWRLKTIPKCYTLEGTENLEDEMFIKRHQKPEYEEKRRKRWDLQRIREQRMHERLKEKEKIPEFIGTYPRQEDNPTVTFFPAIEDISHVEVCDRIPVSAFGCPIPFIKPSEFHLPWERELKEVRSVEKPATKQSRWNMRRK